MDGGIWRIMGNLGVPSRAQKVMDVKKFCLAKSQYLGRIKHFYTTSCFWAKRTFQFAHFMSTLSYTHGTAVGAYVDRTQCSMRTARIDRQSCMRSSHAPRTRNPEPCVRENRKTESRKTDSGTVCRKTPSGGGVAIIL
jgi:hypothetical protein